MTEHQRKLMFFGQSVLNLIDPTEIQYEWDDILDRMVDNSIDLGLAEWVKQEDGSHEFILIKPNE